MSPAAKVAARSSAGMSFSASTPARTRPCGPPGAPGSWSPPG